jgi:hypothetical protein
MAVIEIFERVAELFGKSGYQAKTTGRRQTDDSPAANGIAGR